MIVQWKDNDKFMPFDESLFFLPRNHFLDLFRGKVPVVAKEGETYLTNDTVILNTYKKKGKDCVLFSSCKRSEERLDRKGFLD